MSGPLEPRHLVVLLGSPDGRVREAARTALAALGEAAHEDLRSALVAAEPDVRRVCDELLGNARTGPATPTRRRWADVLRALLRPGGRRSEQPQTEPAELPAGTP
jgi:hypothetical protein